MLKQLEKHLIPRIEKQVDKEVRKEKKYIASMQPHPGQHIFKYNIQEKELSVISAEDFEKTTVDINGKVNKKLAIQKGCIYVVAINKKNATKKVLKLLLN